MKTISPKGIVVHHTGGGSGQSMESLRDHFLITRKAEDFHWIGYHVVINMATGEITQTRPFNKNGGGCPGYNQTHIQVAFMGNSMSEKVSREAWQVYSNLVHFLKRTYNFNDSAILPHAKAKLKAGDGGTDCPGTNILALLKTPLLPETAGHEPASGKLLAEATVLELAETLTAKLK